MPKHMEKVLHECFNPRRGKPGLRRIPVNAGLAKKHMDKANKNLRAMKLVHDNGLFDWTIICGYYAMYHAVLASLLSIGIRADTHYCAVAAFEIFYVERGKVSREYVKYIKRAKRLEQKYAEALDRAKGSRISEQYGIEVLTNDDAEWIIGDAEDFVLKIEEIIA